MSRPDRFKVGDRVRCVSPGPGLTEGAEYEVRGTSLVCETQQARRYVVVRDHRGKLYYSQRPERFELIHQKEGETESATCAEGDPDPTPNFGPWCFQVEPGGVLACTRAPGHDGPHVSGDGVKVISTWEADDSTSDPLVEFKARVWKAAQAAKAEHGWCGEIDAVLERLGVQNPNPRVKYLVTIPVEVEVGTEVTSGLPSEYALFKLDAGFAVQEALEKSVRKGVHNLSLRSTWTVEEVTE